MLSLVWETRRCGGRPHGVIKSNVKQCVRLTTVDDFASVGASKFKQDQRRNVSDLQLVKHQSLAAYKIQ